MDFLNKLYDSNYFGIGLFAVISFLVTTFLIVLFFGKRDEQKRKLQERKMNVHKIQDTFNEVTKATSVEVEPPVVNNIPIQPVSYEQPVIEQPMVQPVSMVTPVNYNTPVTPNIPVNNYVPPVQPVVNNYSVPPMSAPSYSTPVAPVVPSVQPIENKPIVITEPVIEAPTPTIMEPVKINIPEFEPVEQPSIAPVLVENNINNNNNNDNNNSVEEVSKPVVEEPIVTGAYYRPVETNDETEVKVPSIDFDAIAKSISEELEELEKSTNELPKRRSNVEDVPQFSSVYVREPVRNKISEMDLPTKRDEY